MLRMMPSNTYILCPGQGAQVVGMGKDFYDASPAAQDVFDTRERGARLRPRGALLRRARKSGSTRPTSASRRSTSPASPRSRRARRGRDRSSPAGHRVRGPEPRRVHGAAPRRACSGSRTGLKLVAARGRYMQEAAVATPSGMVAILGADEAAVHEAVRGSGAGRGARAGELQRAGADRRQRHRRPRASASPTAAEGAGFKAMPLKVAGAFHSPLMQRGADRMRAELDKVDVQRAARRRCTRTSPRSRTRDAASIKQLLVDQIVKPVRWEQTMQKLVAAARTRGSSSSRRAAC